MAELVGDLPLAPSVAEALVDGTGPLGDVLAAVRAYERADLRRARAAAPPASSPGSCRPTRDAAAWARDLQQLLEQPH